MSKIQSILATALQALPTRSPSSELEAALDTLQESRDRSNIVPLCGRCLNDAGHQCGMAGAARCPHIEMWEAGRRPSSWIPTHAGAWSCFDFEDDLVLAESVH